MTVEGFQIVQIIGADIEGNFTEGWIFTGSKPLEVFKEVQKYHKQFPDIARICLDIALPVGTDRRTIVIKG